VGVPGTMGLPWPILATMRGILAGIVSVVLAVVLPGVAGAAGSAATHCRYDHEANLSPGLSLEGSSGTIIGTASDPSSITCDGPVYGFTPSGPGTFVVSAQYGTEDPDDCLRGGEGESDITFTWPTTAGLRTASDHYHFAFAGPAHDPANDGPYRVHGRGGAFTFDGGAIPTRGDCVTKPLTRARARGVMTFG